MKNENKVCGIILRLCFQANSGYFARFLSWDDWSEHLRVDNELSNINSGRDVDEEDEATLRSRIQDISSGMQPRRASRPSSLDLSTPLCGPGPLEGCILGQALGLPAVMLSRRKIFLTITIIIKIMSFSVWIWEMQMIARYGLDWKYKEPWERS